MLGVAGVAPPHTKASKIKGIFLKNSFFNAGLRPRSGGKWLNGMVREDTNQGGGGGIIYPQFNSINGDYNLQIDNKPGYYDKEYHSLTKTIKFS